jgi:hypothetical protein
VGTGTQTTDSFFGGYEGPKVGFSIMQGMTDETTSQFTAVLPKTQPWIIEIVLESQGTLPMDALTIVVDRDFSDFSVYKTQINDLSLGENYLYRVKDASGTIKDERRFTALDTSSRRVRVAFVSCQLDLFHHDDVWNALEAQAPDVVFFTGDNIYADRTSLLNKSPADPRQLWERYVITRNRVRFYYQKNLRPVLATWDDHDYGTDNGDRTFPYSSESREQFNVFFAQDETGPLTGGPGIARKFTGFGADFYLFDGRSFRDVAGSTGGKLLGEEQEAWFFGGIGARPGVLINGSVFYGGYQNGESFEGSYNADFKKFIARLKASGGTFAFV